MLRLTRVCVSVPAHVCTLAGTSHHCEGLFAVCVSIRQGERNRHLPHIQAVCPPQPREKNRDTGAALVCVHKLLENTETVDRKFFKVTHWHFMKTKDEKSG